MINSESIVTQPKKDATYSLYMHIFPNGKKYVGVTSQKPENRWLLNGIGYKGQPFMWKAIQKYGWDNVEHKILETGLIEEEAFQKEVDLINQLNLTDSKYGYNISEGGKNISNRKIICLSTLEVFSSKVAACDKYGIAIRTFTRYLKKYRGDPNHYCGKSNNIRLIWDYYEKDKTYNKVIYAGPTSQIINLSTLQIFEDVKEASRVYNCSIANFRNHFKGKNKYCGLDKDGNGMIWEKYDKTKTYSKRIFPKDKIRELYTRNCTPVICLNTLKVYPTIAAASEAYGIDKTHIGSVCLGKRYSAGKDNAGNPLIWSYYELGKVYEQVVSPKRNQNLKRKCKNVD